MRIFAIASVIVASAILGSTALAVTITFDDPPVTGNPLRPSHIENGFSFTSAHQHVVSNPSMCSNGGCVVNGTQYLVEEQSAPVITLSRVDGQTFSLSRFDGAEIFLNNNSANPSFVEVVGTKMAGVPVTTMLALDGLRDGNGPIDDFQTFHLPATFSNLLSATFSGRSATGGQVGTTIDNVVVNEPFIPEPGTLTLLAAIFAVAGIRGRVLDHHNSPAGPLFQTDRRHRCPARPSDSGAV